jgi:two-component system response regulator YesN
VNYSVLIVDDEPLIRTYLRQIIPELCPAFGDVEEAKNGTDALDRLKERSFDLIITDIRMPKIDGLALTAAVKELLPEQLIIILSGYNEFFYAQEAIQYGVSNYLLKPIEKVVLLEALAKAQKTLTERQNKHSNQRYLKDVLSEYNKELASEYLEIFSDQGTPRQKALQSLLEQMDIPLFGLSNIVLAITLDESTVFIGADPVSEFEHGEFILYKALWDMAHELSNGTAYYFYRGRHMILLSGDPSTTEAVARSLFERLSAILSAIPKVGAALQIVAGVSQPFETETGFLKAVSQAYSALSRNRFEKGPFYSSVNNKDRTTLLSTYETSKKNILYAALKHDLHELKKSSAEFLSLYPHFTNNPLVAYVLSIFFPMSELLSQLSFDESVYRGAMKELYAELNSANSTDKISLMISRTFQTLLRPQDSQAIIPGNIQIEKAKEYINRNYQNPISLLDIAEYVGISPNYLSMLFGKYENETYIKFLTRIRMKQAAKLLVNHPEIRISDVAEQCGFLSIKHFYHVFKQTYDKSPSVYAKEMQ